MLTKEQILRKMQGFECPQYLMESCWQPIYDQCVAAIDLAAENARLKAKLATLREAAQEASACGAAFADEVLEFLAIIDKDGDTDA